MITFHTWCGLYAYMSPPLTVGNHMHVPSTQNCKAKQDGARSKPYIYIQITIQKRQEGVLVVLNDHKPGRLKSVKHRFSSNEEKTASGFHLRHEHYLQIA